MVIITNSKAQAVADRIARAIVDADLSKTKVSELSGIPRTTLDRKLRGGSDFGVQEVIVLAAVLDVSPEWLFTGNVRAVAVAA